MSNRQTNKIRLCKKTIRKINQGEIESIKKTEIEIPSHSQGIMVDRSACSRGVGELIFLIGTMDNCAYKQALKFYKKDLSYLSINNNLKFQQDHTPFNKRKGSLEKLNRIKHFNN